MGSRAFEKTFKVTQSILAQALFFMLGDLIADICFPFFNGQRLEPEKC